MNRWIGLAPVVAAALALVLLAACGNDGGGRRRRLLSPPTGRAPSPSSAGFTVARAWRAGWPQAAVSAPHLGETATRCRRWSIDSRRIPALLTAQVAHSG